jgi:hypothetical protein
MVYNFHSFIETALLKCYRFITREEDLKGIVARLSMMIRGIGDPIVAVYARTFLSIMAAQVIHGDTCREACLSGIFDFLLSYKVSDAAGCVRNRCCGAVTVAVSTDRRRSRCVFPLYRWSWYYPSSSLVIVGVVAEVGAVWCGVAAIYFIARTSSRSSATRGLRVSASHDLHTCTSCLPPSAGS